MCAISRVEPSVASLVVTVTQPRWLRACAPARVAVCTSAVMVRPTGGMRLGMFRPALTSTMFRAWWMFGDVASASSGAAKSESANAMLISVNARWSPSVVVSSVDGRHGSASICTVTTAVLPAVRASFQALSVVRVARPQLRVGWPSCTVHVPPMLTHTGAVNTSGWRPWGVPVRMSSAMAASLLFPFCGDTVVRHCIAPLGPWSSGISLTSTVSMVADGLCWRRLAAARIKPWHLSAACVCVSCGRCKGIGFPPRWAHGMSRWGRELGHAHEAGLHARMQHTCCAVSPTTWSRCTAIPVYSMLEYRSGYPAAKERVCRPCLNEPPHWAAGVRPLSPSSRLLRASATALGTCSPRSGLLVILLWSPSAAWRW